jgi:Predicted membrane protein (DUF2085)
MIALRRAFSAGVMMWTIVLPLATFVVSRPHASTAMYGAALAVYAAGSIVCHQLPERTFHLWSTQMPVCARCTGIYGGGAIAAIILLIGRADESVKKSMFVWLQALNSGVVTGFAPRQTGAATRPGPHRIGLIVMTAALPTLATLGVEWSTGHTPANWLRAAAGVPLGGAVAWAIGSAPAEPREVN